jgi:hypothetical protein
VVVIATTLDVYIDVQPRDIRMTIELYDASLCLMDTIYRLYKGPHQKKYSNK